MTYCDYAIAGAIDTKALTAHVPLEIAEKVGRVAARLECLRGWVMKQALSAWVDLVKERDRLTREALAEVDNGLLTAHQAVQVWAESLSTNAPSPMPR